MKTVEKKLTPTQKLQEEILSLKKDIRILVMSNSFTQMTECSTKWKMIFTNEEIEMRVYADKSKGDGLRSIIKPAKK